MAFSGGYTFSRFEGAAEPTVIEAAIPDTVSLPLVLPGGVTFEALAKQGDTVKAGEPLLRAQDSVAALPAPVNGKVISVDESMVKIESDGSGAVNPVAGHTREPWHLDRKELFNLFMTSGCCFLMDTVISSPEDCEAVNAIVVNAVHNGPLGQNWLPELSGDQELMKAGLKTLHAVFPNAKIAIAINKRNKHSFETAGVSDLADISVMSDKFPQEHPELLVRDIHDRRLVSEDCMRDQSVILLSHCDVIQLAETMNQGKPLIDRNLMIAGPGVSKPAWYRIRTGTTIGDLKQSVLKADEFGPWRIIRGDVMTGTGIENTDESITVKDTGLSVIGDKADRALFGFMMPGFAADSYSKSTAEEYIPVLPKKLETNVHGGVRPCVQCNYCDEVCPVGIYPFLIWKYVTADKVEDCFRFRPYDCIECGLCDYVCPSKIEISAGVKAAKNAYCELRRDNASTD